MSSAGQSSSGSASSTSILSTWANIADIFSKLVVGAAIAFYGLYLTQTKNDSDRATQCSTSAWNIFDAAQKKSYSGDELNEMIQLVPSFCNLDRNHFVQVLSAVSQSAQRTTAAKSAPSGDGGAELAPPGGGLQGWAALGFLNSDLNFNLANGQSIQSAPAAGTLLRAKWQVNIRPGPADWSNTVGVLGTAQCFRVDETRSLSAGGQGQIWAKGARATCP